MRRVRITGVDGAVWTRDVDGPLLNVGRDASNEICLPEGGVSLHHCLLEFTDVGCVVKDRGSSNGTFLNNRRVDEPSNFAEGDLLYVGPYLLELTCVAAEPVRRPLARVPLGPLIRVNEAQLSEAAEFERFVRWAQEWEQFGRPRHLLLTGRLLQRASLRCHVAAQSRPLLAAFLECSRGRAKRQRRWRWWSGAVGMVVVAAVGWAVVRSTAESVPVDADSSGVAVTESLAPVDVAATPVVPPPVVQEWVEHEVIPAESLDDIARRYDVAVTNVVRWNSLNPDTPQLAPGTKLRLKPNKHPLPQQQIFYELEQRFDWKKLSRHFGVPVDKLRAYNPELGQDLPAGTLVTVWIDPQPYDRRATALKIPEFAVRPDALAVGHPNQGSLENGVQMPKSDLYTQRAPNLMWGSSHTIRHLLTAIATFRQEVNFDGVVVVADISKRGGGRLPPHKSHQAGRDVDVWMPTLRGVYKRSYLGRERKPLPNEIDWFATWGLIRALIETGQVLHIFIEYELQEKVYRAAKLMGATDETLTTAMQWPRGPHAAGVLGHSPGHTGHIHVRFRCGPLDVRCLDSNAPSGGQDEGDHAD